MTSKNILVTGGAGYIGSHTVKELLRRGYEPIIIDNLSTGYRKLVVGGEFIQADLRNPDAVRQIFSGHRINAVIHFAASCYVGESVEKPMMYYENNVLCGMNLLAAMLAHDVRCIIFSSSAAVYGNPIHVPIREEHPQNPINPYGQTKSLFEDILRSHERLYGMQFVSLRYFNAAGCDPEAEIGETHEPETHLIPLALDVAVGRTPNLRVFGTDYDTPDGTCIRDFIHVCDLADAHIRTLEYLMDGGASAVFNVGTGTGHSVREIIRAAERVTGRSIPAVNAPRRPGDPPSLVASAEKLKGAIGWTAQHSALDEILSTAWNWHKKLRGCAD
ncbi:MAG: UDP-glucose 4-epimerase GalE [Candidatus Abyssobacteria bacterium SURF_17]|uniref:UDP-glucose 4-epimerase n=1 Tax=Candidatus Abyssobacteria bacterium SURF_17 TaxID=2093361 RepID=A0A419F8F8_9BACT|nr:MAG: UDP-glucose 4-epimerase GalE [Candidatus Abyssubacteria bacterium SURF_17]